MASPPSCGCARSSSRVLLSYFSFSVLTFADCERGVDVVDGGWLIAIVATEPMALLGRAWPRSSARSTSSRS